MKSIAIAAVTLALLVFAAPAEANCHHWCAEAVENYVDCTAEGESEDCSRHLEPVGDHLQEHVEEHLP